MKFDAFFLTFRVTERTIELVRNVNEHKCSCELNGQCVDPFIIITKKLR